MEETEKKDESNKDVELSTTTKEVNFFGDNDDFGDEDFGDEDSIVTEKKRFSSFAINKIKLEPD